MKKILYSIFALSTVLFAATSCTEDNGTTTEVVDSNEDESVNPRHIRGYGDREPGGTPPSSPDADQMYGFSKDELSNEFVADLGVDAAVATQMVEVYYDRSRQLSEMQRAVREEGRTQINDTDMQRIDADTDQRIRGMLSPEQYRSYEQNRSRYNASTTTGVNAAGAGATGAGNQAGQGAGSGTTGSGNQTTQGAGNQ